MWPQAVASLVVQLGGGQIELTLTDLAEAVCGGETLRTLDKVNRVNTFIEDFGLELIPSLSTGELKSKRLLRFKRRRDATSVEDVQRLLAEGESGSREFKSSLLFDHKRFEKQKGINPCECRSAEVLFSALKTIAAFLNTDGGILMVGVADSGSVLGLEYDFHIHETSNADKWELHLRNLINSRFLDGGSINDYVRVSVLAIMGKHIAHIEVLPRPEISFLSKDTREYCLFRRQGNSTTQVHITEFEEFLTAREGRRSSSRQAAASGSGR